MEDIKFYEKTNEKGLSYITLVDELFMLTVDIYRTIVPVFKKYELPMPKHVIIQDLGHDMLIKIVRPNIDTEEELTKYEEAFLYILEDLFEEGENNHLDKNKHRFQLI